MQPVKFEHELKHINLTKIKKNCDKIDSTILINTIVTNKGEVHTRFSK